MKLIALILFLAVHTAAWSGDHHSPERTLTVQDTQIKINLWQAQGKEGPQTPFYSITSKGKTLVEAKETSYKLELRWGSFDPLAIPELQMGEAISSDRDLYVVQFYTQPLSEYRRAIEAIGGKIGFYLPRHAYLVHLDGDAVETLRDLPYVRWVGLYQPAWRVDQEVVQEAGPNRIRYNVMASGVDRKPHLRDKILEVGGKVVHPNAGKYLIEAELSQSELLALLSSEAVAFIDPWSPIEVDMDRIREVSGANHIETVAGYTGQGVRGEVIDVGFNMDHIDFASRPLIEHTPATPDSHGAGTSGIIFGDGAGNAEARGLLPDGQGIVADTNSVFVGPGRYQHTSELPQAPYFAVFQSASVGSARTTQYNTISADTDAMLFDFQVLHLQSQSNAGNRNSRPQAWAKNIVSVGGILQRDTVDTSDDCWCSTASIGPAEDGRIKPDLVHAYDGVFTVGIGSPTAYNPSFCCTSSATPMTAGLAGLAFQMWADGIFGNEVTPGATVFENRPKMTTLKALLINTAQKYPFTGPGHDMARPHQGWGVASVGDLYEAREKIFTVDEADVLGNMESIAYTVEVTAGEPVLRVTMTYVDPAALPLAAIHRINDLSLKVTAPDGTEYWGNNGLLNGNESTPGGVANELDTVENVFVSTPEAGIWTVEVFASEINEDGHVETPEMDADFALVVTGAVQAEIPSCPADLNGDDVIDNADFLIALSRWPDDGETDLNGDNRLDILDLILWLGSFGDCP